MEKLHEIVDGLNDFDLFVFTNNFFKSQAASEQGNCLPNELDFRRLESCLSPESLPSIYLERFETSNNVTTSP